MDRRPSARAPRYAAVSFVLLLTAMIDLFAIDHGNPAFRDRCFDALHPLLTLGDASDPISDFSERGIAYPPLVSHLIGVAQRGWLASTSESDLEELAAAMVTRARAIATHRIDAALRDDLAELVGELIVVGRCVVALFGILAVAASMFLAAELFGNRAAIFAGLLAALNPTLVIYSHTGNVDVPYVALALVALGLAVRAVRTGKQRFLFASALFAGFSICAKDQAYGLFVLTAPFVIAMYKRPGSLAPGVVRRVPYLTIVGSLLSVSGLYLILPGWPIRWDWFQRHFDHLGGDGSEPFRTADSSLSGAFDLLVEVASLTSSGGVFFVSILGLATLLVLLRTHTRLAFFLLLPAISYFLTFLFPIGYSYLRFVLPIQLLVSIGAAVAFAAGTSFSAKRDESMTLPVRALVWTVFLLSIVGGAMRVVRIERLLAAPDPRQLAEQFVRKNYGPRTRIDAWVTRTASDPVLPPWASVRFVTSRPTSRGPVPEVLIITGPYFDDPKNDWASKRIDEFPWSGAKFEEVARFEPPFHELLVQSVLWLPRIVIFEPLVPEASPNEKR